MRQGKRFDTYFKQLNVETALAAQVYPASGSFEDMNGYRRVRFVVCVGALDTALTLQVKQDTSATQTGSIKNITGATVTVGTTDDNKDFVIEVDASQLDTNNGFRYVTLDVAGPTGNDYAAIAVEKILSTNQPVTQPATFPAANYVLLG